MIIQAREVTSRTILEVAKRNPALFGLSIGYLTASIIAGSILLAVFSNDGPKIDYERLSTQGQSTTGIITDIDTQYNITVNNEHPSIISYRYQANGTEVESEFETLAPDKVSRLSVGDSIAIKYLDGQSMIASMESFEFPFELFLLIPGAFLVAGLVIALIVALATRKEITLFKYGKIAKAEVLSITRTRIGRNESLSINYQYKSDSGQTHITEKRTRDVSLANTLKSGDTIKIFVSPTDESKSTLIPKLEIARNNWRID